jgi:hypothetical protein
MCKQLPQSVTSFNPLCRRCLLSSTAMAATTPGEIRIAAPVGEVWAAARDVGAVDSQLER